jgi:type III secretion protein T
MDFVALFNELDIGTHMLALLLGLPRILMIAQIAPFMGGAVVTGQLRITIAIACYLPLHPALVATIPDWGEDQLITFAHCGLLILKEALLGFFIGWLASILFWSIQSAGFFIDNQRGSSMAEGADPLAGEQSSPIGNFLFQSTVYLFYASGAFLSFFTAIYASYEVWQPASFIPFEAFNSLKLMLFFAEEGQSVVTSMLLLAGPIIAACLLTDISLGLVNRFASQLNVYVLAMPIKSGIAALLLIFYFGLLMLGMQESFPEMINTVQTLEDLLR